MTRRSGWDLAFGKVRDDDVGTRYLVALVLVWFAAGAAIIAWLPSYGRQGAFLWGTVFTVIGGTSSALRTLVVRWRRASRERDEAGSGQR